MIVFMISKTDLFKKSVRLTRDLLRVRMLALAAVFLVGLWVNVSIEDALHLATPADDTQRWVFQLGAGIFELCQGVFLLLLLSWTTPQVHKFSSPKFLQEPFKTPYLSSFFAEYLRMLAQCLMYGLLLLVPGYVRYCQLLFMPLIAIFSSQYRAGDQDAMRLSQRLVRGRLLPIMILVSLTIGLEIALEMLPQFSVELHILPLRILFAALGFLISVWAYSVIFLLFENLMIALPDEEEN